MIVFHNRSAFDALTDSDRAVGIFLLHSETPCFLSSNYMIIYVITHHELCYMPGLMRIRNILRAFFGHFCWLRGVSYNHVRSFLASRSHYAARMSSCRFIWVLRLFHLRNHQLKSFLNVLVQSSAGFRERTSEFFGQFFPFVQRYLSLLTLKIAFVSNNDQRNPISTLAHMSACLQHSSI